MSRSSSAAPQPRRLSWLHLIVPDYVFYPRHVTAAGNSVAVFGTTTGSHLGLPDDEEMTLGVIWLAEVLDGRLSQWRVAEDTPGPPSAGWDPAGSLSIPLIAARRIP